MTIDFSRCKLPPYKHQERGVHELIDNKRFGLWWQMRLGKTKCVIDTAGFLFEAGEIQVVVIALPAQVRDVWSHKDLGEIQRHCFVPYKIYDFDSKNSEYLDQLVSAVKDQLIFITISHEFLRQEDSHGAFPRVNQLLDVVGDLKWELVVDEASAFGSYKSLQTRSILALRNGKRT